jgi:hypothetical protein
VPILGVIRWRVADGFGTFDVMRASAERLMSCLYQAGLAADGATSTALGLIGRASGAGGGAAFGPAVLRAI